MDKFIGVDIGGTTIKSALVSSDGEILRRSTIPTKPTRPYNEIAEDIAKQIAELKEDDKVLGVGVGCPGIVNSERGYIDYSCNLYWKDVPLADELGKLTGLKVRICNDASAAALGEAKFGAGKGYTDSAFVTLGTGVGGGFVVDGKLFEGYRGLGAELGHMVIRMGGVKCTCGRRGCFEAYASATALIRDTEFAMKNDLNSKMWEYVGGDLNRVDGKTSFECAKTGDIAAQEVVNNYIKYLAEGIANIINIFRSQAVIIGGGISAQGEYLTVPLQHKVDALRYGGEDSLRTEIVVATLGNNAGILGAASLFMK